VLPLLCLSQYEYAVPPDETTSLAAAMENFPEQTVNGPDLLSLPLLSAPFPREDLGGGSTGSHVNPRTHFAYGLLLIEP
jgi:hypothetical protein